MLDDTFYDYPPFPGYTDKAFSFLQRLAKNNRREWFTPQRKAVFESELVFPTRALLAEIGRQSIERGLPWRPDPKKSIFRIYRDIRFSKDKRPFKTSVGAVVNYADEKRKGIGCYFHLDPGESFFGGGAYFLSTQELKKIRSSIDSDPERLRTILATLGETFAPVRGEQLKRAPRGYDNDHPAIDLLRYKQLWSSRSLERRELKSPDLAANMIELSDKIEPLCTWLYSTLRGGKTPT